MKGFIPSAESLADKPPGIRMKYYRLKNNLTQRELAEKCGLTESAIRNYELGYRSPNEEQRTKIAKELKVSVFAISEPDISMLFGMMHVLFDIEKMYGITPKIEGDKVWLNVPGNDNFSTTEDVVYLLIKTWAKARQLYESKEVDLETYIDWQSKYPEAVKELKIPKKK